MNLVSIILTVARMSQGAYYGLASPIRTSWGNDVSAYMMVARTQTTRDHEGVFGGPLKTAGACEALVGVQASLQKLVGNIGIFGSPCSWLFLEAKQN